MWQQYIKDYKRAERKRFWMPILGTLIGLAMLGLLAYLWIGVMDLYYDTIGLPVLMR